MFIMFIKWGDNMRQLLYQPDPDDRKITKS